AVIEVDKVRQIMHAIPNQRPILSKTCPNRLEHWASCPKLSVAIHARLCGGNAGERRLLNPGVAIPAVDSTLGNVVLVTEWHRLLFDYAGIGYVGRSYYFVEQPTDCSHDERRTKNSDARNRVHARVKDLRHRSSCD